MAWWLSEHTVLHPVLSIIKSLFRLMVFSHPPGLVVTVQTQPVKAVTSWPVQIMSVVHLCSTPVIPDLHHLDHQVHLDQRTMCTVQDIYQYVCTTSGCKCTFLHSNSFITNSVTTGNNSTVKQTITRWSNEIVKQFVHAWHSLCSLTIDQKKVKSTLVTVH